MDVMPGRVQTFPSNIPLPYYMAYPGYMGREQQKTVIRDLEYLQLSYPDELRRYVRKIAEVLDKIDYEGSMIYDEYPDKYSILRLTRSVVEILNRENAETDKKQVDESLILVLVSNEIYKRRQGGRRGFLTF